MSLDRFISPYIASQFPRLYREEGQAFIQFIKCYYEWMEQEGNVLEDSKLLPEYRDIDDTLPEFLEHFKNKYMAGLPENALGDKRTLQKHIKEIYSSKGTAKGLELLFRLLYNESSEIYLPGNDILRPSDGVWNQPVYLEVSVNPYNVLLIGEKITGRESQATAIVEDFQIRYINRRQINVLFLSNVRGDFKTNEIILNEVIEDPLNSPFIIGSMSEILINESGFGFSVGDVLEVGAGSGLLGKAIVSSVSPRNGAVAFSIEGIGSGFANNNEWAPNTITVEAIDEDNPGIGADFEIGEISNTEVIVTPVDIIGTYANTQLNTPDYQFPTNVGTENINTPLDQALNVQNITVGSIKTLRAINPGAGYNGPVTVTVDSPVISGLMIEDPINGNYKGNNAIISGKAAAGNGAIDTVKIINSGIGYANGDVITLFNANVDFVAGGFVVLSKQGIGEGFWKDTRSFLNSDKYIQDSFYYQEYSYETRLSVAFSYYADLLKKLWHPAGTQGFGKVVVSNVIDSLSEAVEVDIVATRITEYLTMFGTHILTQGVTTTEFVSQYATAYSTESPTDTNRTTSEDYLINEPNLIINGAFNFNTDNWFARGDSNVSWSNNAMVLELVTEGEVGQLVTTEDGKTYQLDLSYSGANGTVTVYAASANSLDDVIVSNVATGEANTIQMTFDSVGTNTYIIFAVSNTATFDDVQLRNVPTLTQQTNYATVFSRETGLDSGSRQTVYNTSTAFTTTFNTQYSTVFDHFPTHDTMMVTQALTGSSAITNRATNRTTSSVYNTVFDTSLVTNVITATNRLTAFATNRATSTAYDTVFNTTFATNRATTSTFNTAYDTVFGTNRVTATAYVTTFGTAAATNRATTSTFTTSKATTTVFNTSAPAAEARGTSRNTTTNYTTHINTSKTTNTSRSTSTTTAFNTTYLTSYVTSYNSSRLTAYQTVWQTVEETYSARYDGGQDTIFITLEESTTTHRLTAVPASRTTSRNTTKGTSRGTTKNTTFGTTTSYVSNFAESRSTTTSYTTSYVTTTTFATNFSTTTAFFTNRATTTTFNTTEQTNRTTTIATTTAFNTDFATNRSTNKVTTTGFDTTNLTNFATNRATTTSFDTSITTTFDTVTARATVFATNRSTNVSTTTAYTTSYQTGSTKLTELVTTVQTATSVPTVVTTLTNRNTVLLTNRATSTNRTTLLATTIGTSVSRETGKTTVFVAYPTSFITAYATGTQIATDYQTNVLTEASTDTEYDTDYGTERLTSVLTQTDVADE